MNTHSSADLYNLFSSYLPLQKHSTDVDMMALWLKNSCVLHDLLTQHSPKQVR